ncbi:hypothetical protein EZV62_008453 [Acer yangbiense]|uniref:Bulb-type lectin domain-containing protein n=1 Tax=Acer yangbiense TaxID=1000413 RepID=A0A5C7IDQ7_9ROSI|nr:hypothetical protein EZV62_008453 [Acer yangbiense]
MVEGGTSGKYSPVIKLKHAHESFDYPTDTLLPGMKLVYDLLTRVSWSLLSWKSSQDPAPGVFSLAQEGELIIKNGSKIYWSGARELFNLSFSTDYYGSSYVTLADELKHRRVVLDVSGQLKLQSWTEGVQGWYTL